MNKIEKEWLRKFYEGSFLVKGWNARSQEIIQKVPSEEKEQLQELLAALGEKIGTEWAKDNAVRKIDSSMLQKWGDELHAAGKEGHDALLEKIRQLESEADSLLA